MEVGILPTCAVCGGSVFRDTEVLWSELIAEWELDAVEVAYIDRQQGTKCADCGTNLRGCALGAAISAFMGVTAPLRQLGAHSIRVLDLNGCQGVSDALANLPNYERHDYPQIDMHAMPFSDGAFDLVIHSDTLEHVENPRQALRECMRVTAWRGAVIFTIPIIVGRLSRSRDNLPLSFHGAPSFAGRQDFAVRTEFGADFWTYALQAGASSIAISTVEFPSAQAITLRP